MSPERLLRFVVALVAISSLILVAATCDSNEADSAVESCLLLAGPAQCPSGVFTSTTRADTGGCAFGCGNARYNTTGFLGQSIAARDAVATVASALFSMQNDSTTRFSPDCHPLSHYASSLSVHRCVVSVLRGEDPWTTRRLNTTDAVEGTRSSCTTDGDYVWRYTMSYDVVTHADATFLSEVGGVNCSADTSAEQIVAGIAAHTCRDATGQTPDAACSDSCLAATLAIIAHSGCGPLRSAIADDARRSSSMLWLRAPTVGEALASWSAYCSSSPFVVASIAATCPQRMSDISGSCLRASTSLVQTLIRTGRLEVYGSSAPSPNGTTTTGNAAMTTDDWVSQPQSIAVIAVCCVLALVVVVASAVAWHFATVSSRQRRGTAAYQADMSETVDESVARSPTRNAAHRGVTPTGGGSMAAPSGAFLTPRGLKAISAAPLSLPPRQQHDPAGKGIAGTMQLDDLDDSATGGISAAGEAPDGPTASGVTNKRPSGLPPLPAWSHTHTANADDWRVIDVGSSTGRVGSPGSSKRKLVGWWNETVADSPSSHRHSTLHDLNAPGVERPSPGDAHFEEGGIPAHHQDAVDIGTPADDVLIFDDSAGVVSRVAAISPRRGALLSGTRAAGDSPRIQDSSTPPAAGSVASVGARRRKVGRIIQMLEQGKWQKGRLVGRGSTGAVYQCILHDGTLVAMKCIDLTVVPQEDQSHLVDELRLMADLDHPNIVQYYHASIDHHERAINIWMEYCAGGSLAQLAKRLEGGQALAEPAARSYVYQIVRGLQYLHGNGVVHRDIKADNILMAGSIYVEVKIADFGSAKLFQGGGLVTMAGGEGGGGGRPLSARRRLSINESRSAETAQAAAQFGSFDVPSSRRQSVDGASLGGGGGDAHTIIGTPLWMAPEVICPDETVRLGRRGAAKADIWSLGITVAELLMPGGEPPWPAFESLYHAMLHIGHEKKPPRLPDGAPKSEPQPGDPKPRVSYAAVLFMRQCWQVQPMARPSATQLLHSPWIWPLHLEHQRATASGGGSMPLGTTLDDAGDLDVHPRFRDTSGRAGGLLLSHGGPTVNPGALTDSSDSGPGKSDLQCIPSLKVRSAAEDLELQLRTVPHADPSTHLV